MWKKRLRQYQWLGLAVFLALGALGFFLFTQRPAEPDEVLFETSSESTTASSSPAVKQYVDIKGAVKAPGMYQVDAEMRVFDAIELAGGFLAEADTDQVNFAQHVTDQMVIYVPKVGEETAPSVSTLSSGSAEGDLVNINTADAERLQTLPGIGPKKAAEIIQYRETNGSFQSVDELEKVSGIGKKTVEKLQQNITIE